MAVLKSKEIKKMNADERESKLKELRVELTKSSVTANKASAKPKEIKRAIARILTINTSDKKEALNKK